MDLHTASVLARSLLAEHALHDWAFAFNRRKRAFGLCDYSRHTIYLSSVLTKLNGEAEVRDTLLHEVAHALAGHCAGHGPVWRKIARKVGARPRRCYRSEEVKQPPSKYLLVCPSCNASTPLHRRPIRVYACHSCCERLNGGRFSVKYLLQVRLLER